jgi:tRNA-dihydrouridine synthase B
MIEHLDNLYAFYGEYTGVRMARKHIAWYSKGQPDGAAFRRRVNRVETIDEQLRMTHGFFDSLSDERELAA